MKNLGVNTACTEQLHHLDRDFCFSSPDFHTMKIGNIHLVSHRTIHSTGTDPAISQPHKDPGSCDENFLDYTPAELIEQPDNSSHHISDFVAATDATMRFSAIPPIGGYAITSISQPVFRSDSNNNSNDITCITNMNIVESTRLEDGRRL
jgi:hypothetical protein